MSGKSMIIKPILIFFHMTLLVLFTFTLLFLQFVYLILSVQGRLLGEY
jgi:hypothetical protein